ncbi:MAG: hypothetical protein NMNS02_09330 [Nitrosomonas sp.]|nr:MAG: hypothetical protein NMNS02_09330 [Nitrosomonas sp.]
MLQQVEKRFEAFDERNGSFVIWSCATTLSVIGVVIAAINYLSWQSNQEKTCLNIIKRVIMMCLFFSRTVKKP